MSSSNFGAPPSGIICHQGFMTKRGANYKTWRKRFFILLNDGYLIYFKEQEDLHHPLGIIYLQNAFLDRLSAEQCERNRPHSFVVRSTTRRFILCSETSSEKEDWIKNIERVISQANARMKMMDSRSSVSGFRASDASPLFQKASSQTGASGVDNVELRDIDREISKLEKKVSDCILHSNSFESRIPEATTNNNNNNGKKKSDDDDDDDDGDDDGGDDDDESTNSTSSGSGSDNGERNNRISRNKKQPVTVGRRRQNTIKSKSRRISNLEKMNSDIDKLMQTFVKMNSYLLALDKEKEKAEQDIKELKNHKKSEIEETLKRITSHKGVTGIVIVNSEGIPIRSNLDNDEKVKYASLITQLTAKARSVVRDIDATNDLTFLRVRTKKDEILIAPVFSQYHSIEIGKEQYLSKKIPTNVKMTYEILCTGSSTDSTPCDVYFFKNEESYDKWNKGSRDPQLWDEKLTKRGVEYASAVNIRTNQAYYFVIANRESNKENISIKYNYRYDLLVSKGLTINHVFGPEARNKDVYDRVAKGVVDSCLTGYNGVVFAYGQTSSGKTHSVVGYDGDKGLIPMAMHHVFEHIKSSRREWLLRISYIEVYNEQLHDLLNPATPPTKLVIFEDDIGHTQVKNLQEEIVRSERDVMDLLAKGAHNRHVSATAMNAQSSRSHAVFTMIIESKEIGEVNSFRFAGGNRKSLKEKGSAVTVSCLYMVDLAGSERGDKTLAVGKTLGEGSFINKSLLNLSKCITQLAKSGGKKTFISYRDSKLTRLIRVGLGGNSKLSVLCCITPGHSHYQESISTMRFGQSARMIQNKSTVNQVKDETALLKQYKREIEELRQKLTRSSSIANNEELVQELERHKEERQELENALKEITQLILVGDVSPDPIEEREFVGEDGTDQEDNSVTTQQGVLLDIDSDLSTLSDNDADIDTSDSILSPIGSPKSQSSYLSTSSPSHGHHRSSSMSSIPSLALTSVKGESSLLSKLKSGKNVAADLKQQIKLLRETIEDLKNDKANFERQRQQWEEERKTYEEQRLGWETEKASMKTEQRFIKYREQDFIEQRNEWKKREQEHQERLNLLHSRYTEEKRRLENTREDEKHEYDENKKLVASLRKELEVMKTQIQLKPLITERNNSCECSTSSFIETDNLEDNNVQELKNEVEHLRRVVAETDNRVNALNQTCAQLKEKLMVMERHKQCLEEQDRKNQRELIRVTRLLEEITRQAARQQSAIHWGSVRWLFDTIRNLTEFFLINTERTVWILVIVQVLLTLL